MTARQQYIAGTSICVFTLEDYLRRTHLCNQFYLASITMGGREMLNEEFDLNSGSLPLSVVYKSNGGGVRGSRKLRIRNPGSLPAGSQAAPAELIRRVTCKDRGRFEIANMRTGDYYAFAFDRAPGLGELLFGFGLEPGYSARP